MAQNKAAWLAVYDALDDGGGYSPREVKAQAMALTVLGYSAREIERQLRRTFPGKYVPPWSTISRWQRSRPSRTKVASLRWADVALRAQDILSEHLDQVERGGRRLSFRQMITLYKATHDAYQQARSLTSN